MAADLYACGQEVAQNGGVQQVHSSFCCFASATDASCLIYKSFVFSFVNFGNGHGDGMGSKTLGTLNQKRAMIDVP